MAVASDNCIRLSIGVGLCFLMDLVVAMMVVVVGGEDDDGSIRGFGFASGCRNFGRDCCGVACVHQCCIGIS